MEADIGAYSISEQSRPRPATGAEYLGCSGADFGKSSKVLLWVFEIVRNRFSAYWLCFREENKNTLPKKRRAIISVIRLKALGYCLQ